ncbi:hypothetical protein ZWY2020_053592 [Hordeum vulgare]|nr:hypothetical protein ZWY2020_053592 [Hordeum vulgare]
MKAPSLATPSPPSPLPDTATTPLPRGGGSPLPSLTSLRRKQPPRRWRLGAQPPRAANGAFPRPAAPFVPWRISTRTKRVERLRSGPAPRGSPTASGHDSNREETTIAALAPLALAPPTTSSAGCVPRPRLHHARPRLAVSYWPIHGNGPYHPPPATPSPEAEVIEARQPLSSRSGRTGTWSPAVLGLADDTSDGASNGVAPGTRLPVAAPTRKSVEAWRVLLPALMQPSDHGSFRL